jgi:hypothetical protein
MGRHVNTDVAVDQLPGEQPDPARQTTPPPAASDHWLEPQAVISGDTHVGTDFDEVAPGTPDAAASPANPNALIEHGLVGDGTELE